MRLEQICQKLETLLSSRQGGEARVEASVDALCSIYGVERNEVAVFALDPGKDAFRFLWPAEMRRSGSTPFSADRSLLAATARERQGKVNNSFASTPHLFVFESFGREKAAPIQRIMSAPMLKGEELVGVIQVCRKGGDADAALKNFTEPELKALCTLANVVAKHL